MNNYFEAEGGLFYRCCGIVTDICVCMKCGSVLGKTQKCEEANDA